MGWFNHRLDKDSYCQGYITKDSCTFLVEVLGMWLTPWLPNHEEMKAASEKTAFRYQVHLENSHFESQRQLGGGFKHFLFPPLLGEVNQFD